MSDVDIFHAPRDFEFHDFDTRNVTASDGGTATLRFPRLDADAVHALAASVRRHRAEKLARYSTDGIVDVIARAVVVDGSGISGTSACGAAHSRGHRL